MKEIVCNCRDILKRNVELTDLLILSLKFLIQARFLFEFDARQATELVDKIKKIEGFNKDYL